MNKLPLSLISLFIFIFLFGGCANPLTSKEEQGLNVTFTCADNKLQLKNSYSAVNPDNLPQIKHCAEQGHAQSQYIYGNIFYNNSHLGNFIAQAVYWWTKAGKQDYGDAWYRLGLLYQQGFGFDVDNRADTAKAANYFQLGAKAGSSHAQYYLGIALYRGWGISQNQQLARQWWKKAADNGYQPALDAYTGEVAIKWYPVKNSPVWQLFNQVNNKTQAQVFTLLTNMKPYKNDAELELALAEQVHPEPPYYQMTLDMYQVLKYLPTQLNDMPTCTEFKAILTEAFSNELNSHFDSYIHTYIDETQINSALWYALQRVCIVEDNLNSKKLNSKNGKSNAKKSNKETAVK
jgi:hypothetical protein